MKLYDIFNSRGKEFVFDAYERVFDVDYDDYDKLTRNKMFKNIIDLYSDPNVLVELCTKKEIDLLCDGIDIGIDLGNSKNWLVRMNLQFKLLCDLWSGDIPEEFVESIKQAQKIYEDKQIQKIDNDLTLLLGFLRVHGVMLMDSITKYANLILGSSEDDVKKLLEHRRVKFYTSSGYNEHHLYEYSYLDDDEYYDVCDGIRENNEPSYLKVGKTH